MLGVAWILWHGRLWPSGWAELFSSYAGVGAGIFLRWPGYGGHTLRSCGPQEEEEGRELPPETTALGVLWATDLGRWVSWDP